MKLHPTPRHAAKGQEPNRTFPKDDSLY